MWQLGAETGVPSRYRYMIDYFGGVISPNGKWFGAFYNDYDENDNTINYPVIINIETDKRIVLGPYPASMFGLADAMAITDQGTLYIDDSVNGGVVGFTPDGDYFLSQAAPGFSGATVIEGSALDGRVMVGWGTGSPEGYTYGPVKIVDGEYQPLPLPELNYRGDEHDQGAMARGISANGEIIYGTSWENWDFGMLYWVNNGANTEKPKWVGEDVREVWEETMKNSDGTEYTTHLVNGLICQAQLTKISPNGKWIASSYRTETPAEDRLSIVTTQTAAFYNTETETTTIVSDYGESVGVHVTDDGIGFIGIGTLGISSGAVYDLNTGTDLGSTQDWVYDNYGIIIPAGYINYVSADGRFVLGTKAESSAGGVSFINWYIAPPVAK